MQDKDLLDLSQYRIKKQSIAEEQIDEIYQHAYQYALKETNIREKVRAKMIFAKRFQLNESSLMSTKAEEVFHQWFLFDYKTIKGQTLFFQFLQSRRLSEPVKMMGALLLSAALEPVRVKEIQTVDGELFMIGENIMHDRKESLKTSLDGLKEEIMEDSLYFMRKVPLVTEQWLIGPVFQAESPGLQTVIKNQYHQKNHETGILWRTFLKEEAPSYILKDHS
jgi:hypothetical protein